MKRPLALALLSLVAIASFTATSTARKFSPNLRVSPSSPRVNQSVKVSFTAPHALTKGHVFSIVITGQGRCSASAAKSDITRPEAAGRRLTRILRPSDQIGTRTRYPWCRGEAKAKVVETKGAKILGTIASRTFTFRAKKS